MKVHKTETSKKKTPPYIRKAHRSLSNEIRVKSNLKHLAPAGTRSSIINLPLYIYIYSFSVAQQLNSRLGHPLLRRPDYTHIRLGRSERLIGPSQRPLPAQRKQTQQTTSMSSTRFEPAITAIERLQTYALNRKTTGVGYFVIYSCYVFK